MQSDIVMVGRENDKDDDHDIAFRNFVDSCRSHETKLTYISGLKAFCEFARIERYSDICKIQPKDIEQRIISFVLARNKTHKTASIKMNVSAIRHFCAMNDISNQINFARIGKFVKSDDGPNITRDRPYTREEIQKILGSCSEERQRVCFLLLSSAGLRIGALPDLKHGDLEKIDSFRDKNGERVPLTPYHIYKIRVYRGTREEYSALCTPECALHIDRYLAFRERTGEQLNDNSPLIRENFADADAATPHSMKLNSLRKLLEHVIINSGVRVNTHKRHKRQTIMLFHGLRKFWEREVLNAGVSAPVEQALIGHGGNSSLFKSYYRPNESDLIREYSHAFTALTISQEKELALQNEKLREEIADIKELRNELANAKQELKEYKEKEIDVLTARVNALTMSTRKFLERHPEFMKKIEDYDEELDLRLNDRLQDVSDARIAFIMSYEGVSKEEATDKLVEVVHIREKELERKKQAMGL